MLQEITIKEVLEKLEELGWTELIDKRWKQKVIGDIYDNFPDIRPTTLDEILKIITI